MDSIANVPRPGGDDMWLFTTFGFFSVVQKRGDRELTVRARVRGDLEALGARYLPGLSAPSSVGGTDYPWRAKVSRDELAEAVARIVSDVDYANFKSAVASAQGSARAHVYGGVWSAALKLEDLPPQRSRGAKAIAYGGVVVNAAGQVLLREPTGHHGGYVWTFPKGRPRAGEAPERAALREVHEETGVTARIVGDLGEWFEGDTTNTRFFLMELVEAGDELDAETARIAWATPEEAARLLAQTRSPRGRMRDLAVLAAAVRRMTTRA